MSSSSPTGQIASAADIKQENGMESASEGQEAPREVAGGAAAAAGLSPPAPAPFPLEPGDAAAAAARVSGEEGAAAAAAADQVQLHSELLGRHHHAAAAVAAAAAAQTPLAFSPDHVACVCEALQQGGNLDRLARFLDGDPLQGQVAPSFQTAANCPFLPPSPSLSPNGKPYHHPSPGFGVSSQVGELRNPVLSGAEGLRVLGKGSDDLWTFPEFIIGKMIGIGEFIFPRSLSLWLESAERPHNLNKTKDFLLCFPKILPLMGESDGNPSTEDESSKGHEDLSPHPLSSSSDSVTNLSLSSHMEPVYMQQIGNAKISLSSSGVLLNGSLVPSTSPVFLNGNISVNSSTSDGSTFTSESTTVQQGKVFLSSLAPSAVVYTVPNSGQTIGSVKQEGLERSLVFSQLMPVNQNAQINANLSSENISGTGLHPLASSLVNVSPTHNFSLTPPTLLNPTELNPDIADSQPMSAPVASKSTVTSVSNTNYATLQNCSLITGQDLLSVPMTQGALGEIVPTAEDQVGHPSPAVHQDFVREHRLVLQSVANIKENFLTNSEGKATSNLMMLDSKSKYVLEGMVETVCEDLETDKKELAKLQTVQLDEDMQDL
ncbi:homeobox protein six4-like [Lynx pardinus]|uniref:Homeobox protein six4-like n=1 Tax=Lynx pardinus TaxID=191816 RepID=A0A485NJX5_LYNPA|nr:homeobox protein six4-like [Lynx pardinus]